MIAQSTNRTTTLSETVQDSMLERVTEDTVSMQQRRIASIVQNAKTPVRIIYAICLLVHMYNKVYFTETKLGVTPKFKLKSNFTANTQYSEV